MVAIISDYDKLYRLTDEVIGGGVGPTGAVNYQYDAVGNRLNRTSTLTGQTNQSFGYDANDRILTDTFDNNGNTIGSSGNTDEYDFKNRLIRRTQTDSTIIDIFYDGDGNRVAKTVTPLGGPSVTTKYLVDTNNLTGFAQVFEEIESGAVIRVYTYGLDLISVDQLNGATFEISYYLYDGLGSVRGLTDLNSNLTDTYDYDAFGNPLTATGLTPNNYRFTGEQFDEDLGLYFLRARYLNTQTGRFHTLDSFEGVNLDPISLHKYLYANANPLLFIDPSGKIATLRDLSLTTFVIGTLSGIVSGFNTGATTSVSGGNFILGFAQGFAQGFVNTIITSLLLGPGGALAARIGNPVVRGAIVGFLVGAMNGFINEALSDEQFDILRFIANLIVSTAGGGLGGSKVIDSELINEIERASIGIVISTFGVIFNSFYNNIPESRKAIEKALFLSGGDDSE